MGDSPSVFSASAFSAMSYWQPTVLVIDDQATNRHLLAEILRSVVPVGHILCFADPLAAIAHAASNAVDLVCTDYRMPGMDGIEVIRRLRTMPHLNEVPIICVTAIDNVAIRYEALDAGANDYLSRPIDHRECASRCRNLLSMRRYQQSTLRHAHDLAERVLQVTAKLEHNQMEMLHRLAKVAERRDTDTGAHLYRIGRYSALLAMRVSGDESFARMLEVAAPLHDLGKVAIPDSILLAGRPLTESEWAIMRTHTTIGHAMLSGGDSQQLNVAADIAHSHHEKFDGSGYPEGLAGHEIPLAARIVATADVYDALVSVRPYKAAWPARQAREYLRTQAGVHLDPTLVEAFLADPVQIEEISRQSLD
jgi:response regulator RpfG family c-di-GMP phosphodiesterase